MSGLTIAVYVTVQLLWQHIMVYLSDKNSFVTFRRGCHSNLRSRQCVSILFFRYIYQFHSCARITEARPRFYSASIPCYGIP